MSDLQTYTLPVSQPLAKAYIDGDSDVIHTFYNYNVSSDSDWEKRSSKTNELSDKRLDSKTLAHILASYNGRYGITEEMQQQLDVIAEGAQVVIGGQQAGLWTGPLLVIHKVVSIIKAAQEATLKVGKPVVPVFWIAGEDHDFDEVNHTYLITQEQQLAKLTIQKEDDSRTAISRTAFSKETWMQALNQLEELLPGSEFKPALLDKLQTFTDQSRTLTDLFSYIINELFGQYGLLLIDADFEQLRQAEQPMFELIAEQHAGLTQAYSDTATRIVEQGYSTQADFNRDSLNLFYFSEKHDQARLLLYKTEEGFADRKGLVSFTYEGLLEEIKQYPQRFSNNVLTRPLMQDFVFNVLAVVLGPGEIAYWAMTKQAFVTLGMDMPILIPRTSYTLVEGINQKNMLKYDLTFKDVMEGFQAKKDAWLYEQDELKIADQFEQVKADFVASYGPLLQIATDIQAGLGKLGETNMAKIVEQMQYMQNKTIDAQQKQFEAAIRQMDRIEISLCPQNKPQERVVSMLLYWNRYNQEWLDKIMTAPFSITGGHHIINL